MSEPNRAYPNEIAAVVRQQTFFIDSHLSPAASNDGYENAPLMMYGHFSRYRMFIINKDRKRAFANVPVQQMRGMIDLTKAIYPEYIKEKLLGADKQQGSEPEHPCYKVTFSSGNLKGMTPAQILVRDGDKGVEALRGQYKFLRDNLSKYPRNKAVMDAITDAVDLFKSGKLNADSASSGAGKHVTLYDVSLRPLVRQKRNDGMCFVYNCKITWDFTAAAPITIVIENYYAPVEKIEGGRLNVKASQRDASSVISNTMNLSVEEWMWCIHQAEMDMARFEAINAQSTWNDSQAAIARQKNNAPGMAGSDAPAPYDDGQPELTVLNGEYNEYPDPGSDSFGEPAEEW